MCVLIFTANTHLYVILLKIRLLIFLNNYKQTVLWVIIYLEKGNALAVNLSDLKHFLNESKI